MAAINARSLYILALIFALLCEVCFISVLSVFAHKAKSDNATFCWSWKLDDSRTKLDGTCPFLVFVLASLFNSLLLLFTGLYFALRLCLMAEYFSNRLCLKIVLKYGHFTSSLVTTVTSIAFIGLMIGYKYGANAKSYTEYTGGIIGDKHYYLILVVVGTFLSLLSSILSGVLCFRRKKASTDQYAGGLFNVFEDYCDSVPTYEQIN